MIKYTSTDDRIWESVLEVLSQGGRLSRLYKLPQHEVTAMLKIYGGGSSRDLATVFHMISQNRGLEVSAYLSRVGEFRCYAMLHTLIRCMRCWVETESNVQNVRRRWRIANA